MSTLQEAPVELARREADSGMARETLRQRFRFAATAMPAAVALVLSAVGSFLLGSSRIDPDVLEYEAIARNLTIGALTNGVREPIWPLVYYLPVHLLGDQSWIGVRVIGVAGFVFMVIAFQALAKNLFGRGWSILGALLLAASPWMVFQAVRGLREETAAGLVLLLCLGLVQPTISSRRFVAL